MSACAVSALSFSPDGRVLALGDEGGAVWTVGLRSYDGAPVRALELSGRCEGAVCALDWDTGGAFIRANTTRRELRHWRLSGAEACKPSAARDCEWASSACVLSWHARGASDRDDATSARPTCAARLGADATLLLVGDEGGGLSAYTYPCAAPGAERRRLVAHGGPVAALGVCGEASAASLDAHDGSVVLWTLGATDTASASALRVR